MALDALAGSDPHSASEIGHAAVGVDDEAVVAAVCGGARGQEDEGGLAVGGGVGDPDVVERGEDPG